MRSQSFYVAPDGNDENPGTENQPVATLTGARDRIRQLKQAEGLTKEGVTVWIKEGIYDFDETLKLSAEDSGTAGCPIVYRAVKGGKGKVIFDGSKNIPTQFFNLATDQNTLNRLCPAARGKVMQVCVTKPQLIESLRNSGSKLSFNGKMMQLARFPAETLKTSNFALDGDRATLPILRLFPT